MNYIYILINKYFLKLNFIKFFPVLLNICVLKRKVILYIRYEVYIYIGVKV
jgi:hypothetical protein